MIVIVVANLLRRAFATGTVYSTHLFAKVKGWPRVFRVEKATTVERIKKKKEKKTMQQWENDTDADDALNAGMLTIIYQPDLCRRLLLSSG